MGAGAVLRPGRLDQNVLVASVVWNQGGTMAAAKNMTPEQRQERSRLAVRAMQRKVAIRLVTEQTEVFSQDERRAMLAALTQVEGAGTR